MFGNDPAKVLGKARRLLDGGDALGALRLARKAQAKARPPVSGDAAAMVEEARRAVVGQAEERAGRSEADGHLEDAAEWLRGALDYAEGAEERERIQARLGEIEERLEAQAEDTDDEEDLEAAEEPARESWPWEDGGDEPPGSGGSGAVDGHERRPGRIGTRDLVAAVGSLAGSAPALAPPARTDAHAEPGGGAWDPESDEMTLFELYVESLRDDVAERYRGRDAELGAVLVDSAEPGSDPDAAERAAAAVEALAEASPDDPVLRLERARWRLARGDEAAARADLEAAWEAFGDEPLDLGGHLSIPVMWCDAAVAQGDHDAVLARLEERGELTLSHPDLTGFYASALIATGETAEARRFLEESIEHFPRRPEIAHLLGGVLLRGGDAKGAIAVLERSLRVCGAGCAPRDLHVPSLRLLAAALAERGGPADRLADVLLLLRGAQGGELREPGDWMLQARCHELAGEADAAHRARARAGALLEAAAEAQRAASAPGAPAAAPAAAGGTAPVPPPGPASAAPSSESAPATEPAVPDERPAAPERA